MGATASQAPSQPCEAKPVLVMWRQPSEKNQNYTELIENVGDGVRQGGGCTHSPSAWVADIKGSGDFYYLGLERQIGR